MPSPSYIIVLMPPTEPGESWFAYAKDDDFSGDGDDPTPELTKAWGATAGKAANLAWGLAKRITN